MIKSIVDNNECLEAILDQDRNHRKLILTKEEFKYLKISTELLQPFNVVTEKLSAENYSTISLIIPSFCLLLNSMGNNLDENEDDFKNEFKSILYNKIKFYVNKFQILNNDVLAAATFVNPRTKKFSHATSEERKFLKSRAENFIKSFFQKNKENLSDFSRQAKSSSEQHENVLKLSDSSDDGFGSDGRFHSLKKEIRNYINEPKPQDDMNAVEFRKLNSNKYPIVFSVFEYLFTIPATSTPSERLFSKAGIQVWDRRNKIYPEKVEKIMFLFKNDKKLN